MASNLTRLLSRRTLAATLLLAVLSPLAPAAAEPPTPPPYYAIVNATVVTGTGSTIDGATVLVADGLIEAVGTGISVPEDAWVIDGEGLMLYSGLIDGLSNLGIAQEEPSGEGGGFPGASGPPIRGPEDRPKTTPWLNAADVLSADAAYDKWREAGFAAVVTSPADGIFAGQAAVIHLGEAEAGERILASGVAQRITFPSPSFRSFPGTLMGVLSYVGQVFADTRHYSESKVLYASTPRGRTRPEYDRTLEPLEASLAAKTPFLVPANLGREIDRALTMADRWQVPVIIYGGQAAYARADRLASEAVSVIVSVDWPEEKRDRDPEADTPFRTLYHRRLAPTTPQALAEAGVAFAFSSAGVSSATEMLEGVRTAVEAGLSQEAALAGLTSGPAGIYGVADRLGTIERGKIANLVLASDFPWAKDVEIEAVFVDGHRYQTRRDDEPKEPPAADVSGTWEMSLQTPRGARDFSAELEMAEDGKVTGELTSEMGSSSVDEGRMSGDLLRFETTREMGGRSMTASYSLTVEGEHLSGSMSAGPMNMDISGDRTSKPDKSEEGGDKADDEPSVSLDELQAAMAVYRGPVRELDDFAIKHATVYTVSGETIEDGTIVVRSSRIAAVGKDVAIPKGIEVFDAGGGSVIPGIIDAHSHITIDGGGNEAALAVSSMVAIGDILNPDDIGIYRALAGGVTSANILHGSSNPIGGQNAVIKLRWGTDASGLVFEGAPPGIKFALGENPKRSNFRMMGMPKRYPQTRMGVMDVIRQAFVDARSYQQEWQEYKSKIEAGRRPTPPRWDAKLEPLVEILEGKRLVHSHSYRADEILQLLRLADEFGFRIATLQHVLEGYKVADEIAAHGAGASTFSDWWGYKVEAYDAIPHNAAIMTERGVLVSINSDSGEEMRHLNQEAAKTMKWGNVDELTALRMITLNPAQQLGIADRVGSIEVGKDADFVVYDGHPLSIFSAVQQTYVDGDLYFDIGADHERQAAIDEIKSRLMPQNDEDDEDEAEDEDAGDGGEESEDEDPGDQPTEARWQEEVAYSCREEG